MALLPYLDKTNTIVDGAYFHLLPFCKKNCCKEKCSAYYEKLRESDAGCYCCPYGLSSYVYASPKEVLRFRSVATSVLKILAA